MTLKKIAFCGLFFTSTLAYANTSLDFDIPEVETITTYCPPTSDYLGGIQYTSELLGIKEADEPLYDVLAGKVPYVKEASKFFALIDANDECDQVGVMYVAKFLAHFWPSTEEFENNKEAGLTAKAYLETKNPTALLKKARIEARNLVHRKKD